MNGDSVPHFRQSLRETVVFAGKYGGRAHAQRWRQRAVGFGERSRDDLPRFYAGEGWRRSIVLGDSVGEGRAKTGRGDVVVGVDKAQREERAGVPMGDDNVGDSIDD